MHSCWLDKSEGFSTDKTILALFLWSISYSTSSLQQNIQSVSQKMSLLSLLPQGFVKYESHLDEMSRCPTGLSRDIRLRGLSWSSLSSGFVLTVFWASSWAVKYVCIMQENTINMPVKHLNIMHGLQLQGGAIHAMGKAMWPLHDASASTDLQHLNYRMSHVSWKRPLRSLSQVLTWKCQNHH